MLTGRDDALDRRVGVLTFHVERNAYALEIIRKKVVREVRKLHVDIHGHDFKMDGGPLLELEKCLKENIAVLAAGNRDADPVAFLNHVEVSDCLSR